MRKCRVQRDPIWLNGTLATEYQREFPPKQAPRDPRRPGEALLDSAPFMGTTTHRADFTRKAAAASRPARDASVLRSLPFDGTTTYTAQYTPKRADLEGRGPGPDLGWSAPFAGVTTYNAEYIPRSVRPWTAEGGRPLVTLPFEGTSEYRDHYYRRNLPPQQARPPEQLLPSNHVATITTYGADYVPKPFDVPCKDCCDHPQHPAEWHTDCLPRPGTGASSGSQQRPPPHHPHQHHHHQQQPWQGRQGRQAEAKGLYLHQGYGSSSRPGTASGWAAGTGGTAVHRG